MYFYISTSRSKCALHNVAVFRYSLISCFPATFLSYYYYYYYYYYYWGPRWHSGKGAVLQIGRSLVQSQLVSLEFFIDIKSFRPHYGPGVDPASNKMSTTSISWGLRRPVREADNLTTILSHCHEIWEP